MAEKQGYYAILYSIRSQSGLSFSTSALFCLRQTEISLA